ncbi:MAG: cell division protein FtsX [Alphaproteobacteria bacterium]|jgi:cell division transport system permease protein
MSNAQDNNSPPRPARIMPREKGAAPLDVVIGVMAFLAALALGGVLIAERAAETWSGGLTGRLSVQILPEGAAAPDDEVAAALNLLRATPGVVYAGALSDDENLALIEPWLGDNTLIEALPFPRLIDVELAPGAIVDVAQLEARLAEVAPRSILDDHTRWVARLRGTANAVLFSALTILTLIAIATAASVAFATRAGLAAHREMVELLHLMGAQNRFIARAFEWHYFLGALIAASFGALAAGGAFAAAGGLDEIGLSSVSFLPPLGLQMVELPWLLTVPAAAALIAWVTARLSVLSALREYY